MPGGIALSARIRLSRALSQIGKRTKEEGGKRMGKGKKTESKPPRDGLVGEREAKV